MNFILMQMWMYLNANLFECVEGAGEAKGGPLSDLHGRTRRRTSWGSSCLWGGRVQKKHIYILTRDGWVIFYFNYCLLPNISWNLTGCCLEVKVWSIQATNSSVSSPGCSLVVLIRSPRNDRKQKESSATRFDSPLLTKTSPGGGPAWPPWPLCCSWGGGECSCGWMGGWCKILHRWATSLSTGSSVWLWSSLVISASTTSTATFSISRFFWSTIIILDRALPNIELFSHRHLGKERKEVLCGVQQLPEGHSGHHIL